MRMILYPWAILPAVYFLLIGVRSKIAHSPDNYYISKQSTLSSAFRDTTVCRTIPGLTKAQVELCYRQPDTTEMALQGLEQSVKECQQQFATHRWNCSISTKSRNPHTSVMFQKGYRESAFVYALSSAAVVMNVARACSQGFIISCGCDPNKQNMKKGSEDFTFKWGGCSHNLQYGIRFSKQFLDSREKASDIQSKINLHNNQVGRLVIKNNMQIKCKCHGVSGSCELKTCWRQVPDIKQIGKILKDRYEKAILVNHSNLGNGKQKNQNRITTTKKKRKKPQARLKLWVTPDNKMKKKDLVQSLLFYQRSPTFCEKDLNADALGTIGRQCNRTSTGPDNCSSLCCGRGYNLQRIVRTEKCKCRFIWCCQVECQDCSIEEWVAICN
ncbi:protein Wnt-10b [Agrilus planipennis]|uniref:Protein Wnt n=1 Tax=Agrilus planipennis TaxID=224129 RepID=A0A1W4X7W8_AGRPL|nr:protein Wnt-10b [Agrilus planipennis]